MMFSKQVPHLFNILNDVESVNYFSPILCRAFSTSQLFFSVPDPCVFALLSYARFVFKVTYLWFFYDKQVLFR